VQALLFENRRFISMDSAAYLQPFLLLAGFSHIIALLNILRNCIEPEKMQYSEKLDE